MKCEVCQENEAKHKMPDGKWLCDSCYQTVLWFRKLAKKKQEEKR